VNRKVWIRDLLACLEREWTAFVKKMGEGLLAKEVASWMTGVNQHVEGKQVRIIARYSGTAPECRAGRGRAAGGYREPRLAERPFTSCRTP
jgi:hypothetical protein